MERQERQQQLSKILKVLIVTTLILLVVEGIFCIPQVVEFFENLIKNAHGIYVYIVLWIIMFAQVTILNIPAYTILSTSVAIGIKTLSVTYILVVISAYMAGCIVAYLLGRFYGAKAVKWCAGSEEEFVKWSKFFNTKGKWWYFLTILLPLFPDDILCLVAGSVKLNPTFYILSNLIGRTIGLVTMLVTLQLIGYIGGGGQIPIMLIVWIVALIIEVIVYFINKRR